MDIHAGRGIVAAVLLGAHCSIAGGYHRACEEAGRLSCNALQLFTKNQMQWKGKAITEDEVRAFQEARHERGIASVMAHDSYLINLASPNGALRKKSLSAFIDELERCERLGIEMLVTHPGSPGDAGREVGFRNMADSLRSALRASRRVRILLETTAGQGHVMGRTFEEIGRIIEDCRGSRRLAVCLDTCHVFAAGYDLRTRPAYEDTMEAFDRIIGLARLKAIHLNDSKGELGSRVDRHEHIGRGKIGPAAFGFIMTDPRLREVPKVIETPKKGGMDRRNLELLRRMAGRAA